MDGDVLDIWVGDKDKFGIGNEVYVLGEDCICFGTGSNDDAVFTRDEAIAAARAILSHFGESA